MNENTVLTAAFFDELEKLSAEKQPGLMHRWTNRWAIRKANKRYDQVAEGGKGAVKHEYLRARDLATGYPKPGNARYFKAFKRRATAQGLPVKAWESAEPRLLTTMMGIRTGSK